MTEEDQNKSKKFTNDKINWVRYDKKLVRKKSRSLEEPTPEAVFGNDFIMRWASILEQRRQSAEELKEAGRWRGSASTMNRVKKPVTPLRLAKNLNIFSFFSETWATMSEEEADGIMQISSDQLKRAQDIVAKARSIFDQYMEYRRLLSDEQGNSCLPFGDHISTALGTLGDELYGVIVRERPRKQYSQVVREARSLLIKLTGTNGRSVDRSSNEDSGLLFQISFEIFLAIAPNHHRGKLESRIKSAVRQSRDRPTRQAKDSSERKS